MRRISRRLIFSAIALSICLFILLFIVNNLNEPSEHLESPPYKCECPLLIESHAKAEKSNVLKEVLHPQNIGMRNDSRTTTTPPPSPPCKQVDKNSPIQRAIIIYYPHHQSEYFFPEVRWYVYNIHSMNKENSSI